MTAPPFAHKLLTIAEKAALDKGGTDLLALDVSSRFPLADIFFFVTGRSERNVLAIADEIDTKMHENGTKTITQEGRTEGRWVLLDFNGLIVHIFHEQDRTYYSLERLWSDCPIINETINTAPDR